MKIRFLGSGDAFGNGGRLNTCLHFTGDRTNFLLDCGATSLVALKSNGIRLNEIGLILISHYHADHGGGIPFFILDAQFSKRAEPLTIAGPPGLAEWYERAMETGFPGSSKTAQRFELTLTELQPRSRHELGGIGVTPFQVMHGSAAGTCFAYRMEIEGRTIAYTGDTEWTDELIDAGSDSDLLIAEAYFFDKKVKNHLDIATLKAHLPSIRSKRLLLTHLGKDVLARLNEVEDEYAEDGKIIEL